MDLLLWAFVSALGNTGNSLACTAALKDSRRHSAFVTLSSLFPSFLVCLAGSFWHWHALTWTSGLSMLAKNILYGLALYLRFKGLARLGAFQGAVLAASQPVIISFLSLSLLGEQLRWSQWGAVLVITASLLLPLKNKESSLRDIAVYALIPSLMQGLITVIDRWILKESMGPLPFFMLDKLILFPTVALTLIVSRKVPAKRPLEGIKNSKDLLWLSILGLTWGLSSYTYGVSLAGEKTAVVGVIRNLAFPLAALLSVPLFGEKLGGPRTLSVILSIAACGLIFL